MQAHAGALAAQMFVVGWIDEGSSRLPARTTLMCGRADDLAKSCVPQLGQNCRITVLPLSAVLVYSDKSPEMLNASVGTSMFTVPFAEMC